MGMTEKSQKKFWRMKIYKFLGKDKIRKIFHGVLNFFLKQGKSETEGKCIIALGGWTPLTVTGLTHSAHYSL